MGQTTRKGNRVENSQLLAYNNLVCQSADSLAFLQGSPLMKRWLSVLELDEEDVVFFKALCNRRSLEQTDLIDA